MTWSMGETLCFVAVHGDEKHRDNETRLVPCGIGLILVSGSLYQHFIGTALYVDTQDSFAQAVIDAVNERNQLAAEDEDNLDVISEKITFFTKSKGFVNKFGEVLDASAAKGLAKNGKPYNSYPLWNEAKALQALTDSEFKILADSDDNERWIEAHTLAVKGSARAAKSAKPWQAGQLDFEKVGEEDAVAFIEEMIAEAPPNDW